MWYDAVTKEDIKLLNEMLVKKGLEYRQYSGLLGFLQEMTSYGIESYHTSLQVSYEDLPLVINDSKNIYFELFLKWRLRIGK